MRMMLPLFILLLFQMPLGSVEHDYFRSLTMQAEALSQAGDYDNAMSIYDEMMKSPLQDWQKYRLIYNMGSIQLAQKKPVAALTYFEKIKPTDLSLPRFGSCLYLNKGIAYLYYAQFLTKERYAPFEEQLFFLKESLKAFDEAEKLDCMKGKPTDSSSSCPPSFLVNQWRKQVHKQFKALLDLKKGNALEGDKLKDQEGAAAILLQEGIEVAEGALRLSLASLNFSEDENNAKGKALKVEQGKIDQAVSSFIPTVLKEQEMKFRQTKDLDRRCQRSPWNRAIPLFNQGYRAVKEGEKLLSEANLELPNLIATQIQVIRSWKEALELLLIPSQQEMSSPEFKKGWEDNIQRLQEMYLEDQAKPRQQERELYSW